MYAYETPKASKAKSAPAEKSYGNSGSVTNHILSGDHGFNGRGSDLSSLKLSITQNIGANKYSPHISEGSAIVQLKSAPKALPSLADSKKNSRHHIISDGIMKSFIKTLIKHAKTSDEAFGMLIRIMENVVYQYKTIWSSVPRHIDANARKRAYAAIESVEKKLKQYYEHDYTDRDIFLDNIKNDSEIIEMFKWLPSNLVIGPNKRINDPDNRLDLEAFRIRQSILRQPSRQNEGKIEDLALALEEYGRKKKDGKKKKGGKKKEDGKKKKGGKKKEDGQKQEDGQEPEDDKKYKVKYLRVLRTHFDLLTSLGNTIADSHGIEWDSSFLYPQPEEPDHSEELRELERTKGNPKKRDRLIKKLRDRKLGYLYE